MAENATSQAGERTQATYLVGTGEVGSEVLSFTSFADTYRAVEAMEAEGQHILVLKNGDLFYETGTC